MRRSNVPASRRRAVRNDILRQLRHQPRDYFACWSRSFIVAFRQSNTASTIDDITSVTVPLPLDEVDVGDGDSRLFDRFVAHLQQDEADRCRAQPHLRRTRVPDQLVGDLVGGRRVASACSFASSRLREWPHGEFRCRLVPGPRIAGGSASQRSHADRIRRFPHR
jgi:hypothetical protein